MKGILHSTGAKYLWRTCLAAWLIVLNKKIKFILIYYLSNNESALVAAEWYHHLKQLETGHIPRHMSQRFEKTPLQNNCSNWTPTKITMGHLNLWFNCGRYKFASDQRFKNPKSWNCILLQPSTLILVTVCQYMLICKSVYVTIKRILCSSKTSSSKLWTCGFLIFKNEIGRSDQRAGRKLFEHVSQ